MARRPGRHAADDRRSPGHPRPHPDRRGADRAPRLRRRQRAAAAPPARRPDSDARPPGLGGRRRSVARSPPALALGRRAGIDAPAARPDGAARVDPLRPRLLTVGRDADRGPGGRASRAVPAGTSRAHGRCRWGPPPRPAPRRADVAACRPHGPAHASPGCGRARWERRPQAGHVHGHGRCLGHGAAPDQRRQRGTRRESDGHRGARCPARPRGGELGLPPADGDRWAADVEARLAIVVQSFRADLGRRGARRLARPRWQPERSPRGRRRCRHRALSR